MPDYKEPAKDVEWHKTKYDGFKLVKTDHPYKHQKGSGRSRCFELASNGITVEAWTKACAKEGYDSTFVVGCLDKLMGAKAPGWVASDKNDEGKTWQEVRKTRGPRAKKEGEEAATKKKAPAKKKAA